MKNKLCLITGSTGGIGKATAMRFAAKGAIVILNGSNKENGENTVEEIKSKMFNKNIFFEQADLSDFNEVKDLARRINKNYPPLDILINNAAIFNSKFEKSIQGIEKQFAVNYLAHYLLTLSLIEKMSQNARIVNVSSAAHRNSTINFDDLNLEQNYSGIKAYKQSKLANILFTYELARRLDNNQEVLQGRKITVNALHPGIVYSDIFDRNTNKVYKLIKNIAAPFMMSTKNGSENSYFVASHPSLENITSKYFIKKEAVQSSDESYNLQMAQRLWNVSKVLVQDFVD